MKHCWCIASRDIYISENDKKQNMHVMPTIQDMRGVFMARGPGFQKTGGEIYPAIELVDVYQIFCHLLDIEPQDNDGVWERVKALLRNAATTGVPAPSLVACVAIALATSILYG